MIDRWIRLVCRDHVVMKGFPREVRRWMRCLKHSAADRVSLFAGVVMILSAHMIDTPLLYEDIHSMVNGVRREKVSLYIHRLLDYWTDRCYPVVDLARYKRGSVLASTSHRNVVAAQDLESGEMVAIKEVDSVDGMPMYHFYVELLTHCKVLAGHKHVGQLLGYHISAESTVFIFPLYPRSFSQVFDGQSPCPNTIRRHFLALCQAVEYIHSCQIAHRDIKPDNVMFDRHGVLQLIDLGSASFVESHRRSTVPIVTICTRPLEIVQMDMGVIPMYDYDAHAVDIWSLGCMFFFMCTGRYPFHGTNNADMLASISLFQLRGGDIVWPLSTIIGDSGVSLMRRCLSANPCTRPTAREILAATYFSDPTVCS